MCIRDRSKGTAVEMFLGPESDARVRANVAGKIDFILAVGDDRSDEEMFHAVAECVLDPDSACYGALSCPLPGKGGKQTNPEGQDHLTVFCSTVGQKPSKADYYLDDPDDVVALLKNLQHVPQ